MELFEWFSTTVSVVVKKQSWEASPFARRDIICTFPFKSLMLSACYLLLLSSFQRRRNFQKPFATCRVSRILNLIDKKTQENPWRLSSKSAAGRRFSGDSEPFYLAFQGTCIRQSWAPVTNIPKIFYLTVLDPCIWQSWTLFIWQF